uniref:Uncharacterized protein n=1 Tax=Amphimedon queenslandica TaxID=400682 RepID=A0A1X7TVN6_AMPQE
KEGEVASEGNEEEPTALYDQPLIVEGKRKRRSVDLFAFSSPREAQKTPKETQ